MGVWGICVRDESKKILKGGTIHLLQENGDTKASSRYHSTGGAIDGRTRERIFASLQLKVSISNNGRRELCRPFPGGESGANALAATWSTVAGRAWENRSLPQVLMKKCGSQSTCPSYLWTIGNIRNFARGCLKGAWSVGGLAERYGKNLY